MSIATNSGLVWATQPKPINEVIYLFCQRSFNTTKLINQLCHYLVINLKGKYESKKNLNNTLNRTVKVDIEI